MGEFKIWREAVIAYLRTQGVTDWYEGECGGGYAIFGGQDVQKHITEFNKQYLKSNVRNGRIPHVNETRNSIFDRIDSDQELARIETYNSDESEEF